MFFIKQFLENPLVLSRLSSNVTIVEIKSLKVSFNEVKKKSSLYLITNRCTKALKKLLFITKSNVEFYIKNEHRSIATE